MPASSASHSQRRAWELGCLTVGLALALSVYGIFFHRTVCIGQHIRSLGGVDGWNGLTIRFVDLKDTKCNDEDIDDIARLGALASLDLSNTEVTDAGIRRIARVKSLTALTLDGTNVTDEGISYLRDLNYLKYVSVRRTPVTDAAVQRLKLDLPDLKVVTGER